MLSDLDLSQLQEQRFNLLDVRLTSIKEKQAQALAALNPDILTETVMARLETTLSRRVVVSPATSETKRVSSNVVLLSEANVSRKQASHETSENEEESIETVGDTAEVDKIVWPLLDTGKTVRGIEAETGISKATVGRSRLRWAAARGIVSASTRETADLSHEIPYSETPAEGIRNEGAS